MTENRKKEYADKLHKAVCLNYIKEWIKIKENEIRIFLPDEYEELTVKGKEYLKDNDKLDVTEFFELIVEIEYKLKQEMQ